MWKFISSSMLQVYIRILRDDCKAPAKRNFFFFNYLEWVNSDFISFRTTDTPIYSSVYFYTCGSTYIHSLDVLLFSWKLYLAASRKAAGQMSHRMSVWANRNIHLQNLIKKLLMMTVPLWLPIFRYWKLFRVFRMVVKLWK